jgi:hypothetical protein
MLFRNRRIEQLERTVKYLEYEVQCLNSDRDKLLDNWLALHADLDLLAQAVGLYKQTVHTVRYTRKGGPEEGA